MEAGGGVRLGMGPGHHRVSGLVSVSGWSGSLVSPLVIGLVVSGFLAETLDRCRAAGLSLSLAFVLWILLGPKFPLPRAAEGLTV